MSCDRRYYEFREDELRIFVKFILEKPATSNLTIKVNSIDDSAKGDCYTLHRNYKYMYVCVSVMSPCIKFNVYK